MRRLGKSGVNLGLAPLFFLPSMAVQVGKVSLAKAAESSGAATTLTAAETARIQTYLDSRYYAPPDVKHFFQTKFGQMIDCVDFFGTPAAKARAARGKPLTKLPQLPPIPSRLAAKDPGPPTDEFWFNGYPDPLGRPRKCPEGTVPIVRETFADVQAAGGLDRYLATRQRKGTPPPSIACPAHPDGSGYAHVQEESAGGPGITDAITTWLISVPALTQAADANRLLMPHSILQFWLTSGCSGSALQTIEVGTERVLNNVQFFTLATNDGYSDYVDWFPTESAFLANQTTILAGNEVSNNFLGYQVEMNAEVMFYEDPSNGPQWWVGVAIYIVGGQVFGNYWLGYYPADEFQRGFQASGDTFHVGGEVAESTSEWVTRMGTGADPNAGYGQAAYFHDSAVLANGAWNYSFAPYVDPGYCTNGSSVPTDYRLSTTGGLSSWQNYFFVGSTPRVFLGTNYGNSGIWAGKNSGDWTGTCPYSTTTMIGVPVTGLSKPTSGTQGHAVECGPFGETMTSSSCTVVAVNPNGNNRRYTGTGNWDSNYNMTECAYNEYVQAVGQN